MGNYHLGLSTSTSNEATSPHTLNLKFHSLHSGKLLPKPTVINLPPHETMALFQEVERQFEEKRAMINRIESSARAVVNLDLGKLDKKLIEKVAQSLRTSAANYTKSPSEALDATAVPLGWVGLPDGFSLLIGLDHRDQPKAYGLSVKEFSAGDNLRIKLDLMYDERGSFGGKP